MPVSVQYFVWYFPSLTFPFSLVHLLLSPFLISYCFDSRFPLFCLHTHSHDASTVSPLCSLPVLVFLRPMPSTTIHSTPPTCLCCAYWLLTGMYLRLVIRHRISSLLLLFLLSAHHLAAITSFPMPAGSLFLKISCLRFIARKAWVRELPSYRSFFLLLSFLSVSEHAGDDTHSEHSFSLIFLFIVARYRCDTDGSIVRVMKRVRESCGHANSRRMGKSEKSSKKTTQRG